MAKPEVPQSLYEQAWALAGGCVERPYNQKPMHRTAMVIARAILAAKAEERSDCLEAVLNAQLSGDSDDEGDRAYMRAINDAAAAIRKRGEG